MDDELSVIIVISKNVREKQVKVLDWKIINKYLIIEIFSLVDYQFRQTMFSTSSRFRKLLIENYNSIPHFHSFLNHSCLSLSHADKTFIYS